jgi:ribosomal protein L25 (general stress protein Ctc)
MSPIYNTSGNYYQSKYIKQDYLASYLFNIKKRDEIARETFHVGNGVVKDAVMLRFFGGYGNNPDISDDEKKMILQDFNTYLSTSVAQDFQDPKWESVNMYEYGVPLTSCESNFENLFRNWSKWVTNYQETELLSYEYVETVENNARIEYYADWINSNKSLGRSTSASLRSSGGGDSIVYTRELHLEIVPAEKEYEKLKEAIKNQPVKEELFRAEIESHLKMRRQVFITTVQTGDKVYRIKMKIKGQEYDHYVFCRPDRNKVVYDKLFLYVRETRDTLTKLKM